MLIIITPRKWVQDGTGLGDGAEFGPETGVDDGQAGGSGGEIGDEGVAESSGACGGGERVEGKCGTEEAEGLEAGQERGLAGRRGAEGELFGGGD